MVSCSAETVLGVTLIVSQKDWQKRGEGDEVTGEDIRGVGWRASHYRQPLTKQVTTENGPVTNYQRKTETL